MEERKRKRGKRKERAGGSSLHTREEKKAMNTQSTKEKVRKQLTNLRRSLAFLGF